MSTAKAESYSLVVEVPIEATPAKVWAALTKDVGKWWPKHFYTTENPKTYVVEGKLGGRVFEDWGDGAGAMWGTVVVWNPIQKMVWACEMYPGFGGPGRSFVTFELAKQGKATVVRLTDSGLSPEANGHKSSLESGWAELLGYAKGFAESE